MALALAKCEALVSDAVTLGGVRTVVQRVEDVDGASLGVAAQKLAEKLGDPCAVVLASTVDAKARCSSC